MRSKCVCIKNYYNGNSSYAIYKKDMIYEYTDQRYTSREMPDGFNVMFSKGEYLYFRKHQDILASPGFGMFSTYFKTLLEIRKEKIQKINENW